MKNKVSVLGASAIGSYGLLKITQSKIDPYTRFSIGLLSGSVMVFSQNPIIRFAGIGLIIGSALQIIDVKKGGKLSFNNSGKSVFVLHEFEGVKELAPYEIPDYNIDGLTVNGLNGVFKLSNGVYGGIFKDNSIGTSFGVGSLVNSFRDAGFKSPAWANKQTDRRWVKLYERSL